MSLDLLETPDSSKTKDRVDAVAVSVLFARLSRVETAQIVC